MKTVKFFLSGLLFLALTFALRAQSDTTQYYIVDYMKSQPGHTADYVRHETAIWKKIHQGRIKAGTITGWYFYSVEYPAGANTEYNFVTVTRVKGWASLEKVRTAWGSLMSGLDQETLKQIDSTEMFRSLVRSEVWALDDVAYNPNAKAPAKYQMVNLMSVPAGKTDAYLSMEKNIAKPVHAENVKAGKRAGWGLFSLYLPWGSEIPYQYGAVDFYDTWDQVWHEGSDAWAKVHPDKKMADIAQTIESARTVQHGEFRILLDYAE